MKKKISRNAYDDLYNLANRPDITVPQIPNSVQEESEEERRRQDEERRRQEEEERRRKEQEAQQQGCEEVD
jgi:hypothetical protein